MAAVTWNGGTVERWNGGTVERWNGGTVERVSVVRWNGDARNRMMAVNRQAEVMHAAMRNPAKLRLIPAAEELAVDTYTVTATFPASERFGLTAQIRRAAVSVGSNIVEGSQRQGNRAFLAYLHQALGSAAEIQFQLRIAARLQFGKPEAVQALIDQANHVQRMTARLITALRDKGD